MDGAQIKFLGFFLFLLLVTTMLLSSSSGEFSENGLAREGISTNPVIAAKVAALALQSPEKKISVPMDNISPEKIPDTWHAWRSGSRLHEGQDIFAPKGTPVYGAVSGYVVRITSERNNPLGGNAVLIAGRGGRVYYYAHLNSINPKISPGSEITPETIIGYVGTSGNARGTPPHLHFGVYTLRGAINPLPLFAQRSTATLASLPRVDGTYNTALPYSSSASGILSFLLVSPLLAVCAPRLRRIR